MMASEKLLEPILKQTKINNITEIMGLASLGTLWACWYQKACTLAGEFNGDHGKNYFSKSKIKLNQAETKNIAKTILLTLL